MHLFRHNTTVRDKHDSLVDPSVVQMLTNIHDIRQNTRCCSTFWKSNVIKLPQYAPPSWSLTFWPWKWCPSHVWRGLPLCQFQSS